MPVIGFSVLAANDIGAILVNAVVRNRCAKKRPLGRNDLHAVSRATSGGQMSIRRKNRMWTLVPP